MNDELYQVPLSEFTSTRDAIVKRLQAAGDKDAAAELKRARKPSVPAWAANQVVWHAREAWDALVAATEALRDKHARGASPEVLRLASAEQRRALQASEARAAELLARHGHAASPQVLQRVGHTLLALAQGAPGATPGRLDQELQPPGFEALAGMTLAPPEAPAPMPSAPASHTPPTPSAPARAGKHAAAATAERQAAEQERARRRAAIVSAEARHAESRRAVVRARARLETLEGRLATAERELEAARGATDEARETLQAAEAEESEAQARLEALQEEAED